VLDRLFAVGAGRDLETGALERAGEEPAEGVIVFGEEDAGHAVSFQATGGIGK
jgi:hypothetical protein